MKNILLIIAILFSCNALSEEFEVAGKLYTLKEKKIDFSCDEFTIQSLEKSLPHSVNENLVRGGLGHLGNFLIISHTLSYINKNKSISQQLPKLEKLLTSYERIDPRRPYISKPEACPGKNTVLFSMWGGGNCSSVCEAWALVIFSPEGNIKHIEGLTYDEYNKCSNYECPAYDKIKQM